MDHTRVTTGLRNQFPLRLTTIDSHTAGEPTRLIVGGVGPVPGQTMEKKRHYVMNNMDHIRLQLTREPRGHRGMFAALLTEPTSKGADFGLIYMDARRYPHLCGHATIGAVTTLMEAGMLPQPNATETTVTVDTPSGPMEARAFIENGKIDSVAIQTVPSFVYGENETMDMPGLGRITVDTVYVGGFFAMVSADQIDLELTNANRHKLTELGMAIIEVANQQLEVCHPTRSEVTTVDVVEFYDPEGHSLGRGKNVVIYGQANMDRSPCGTGTAAKMTLLHHRGQLAINQPITNAGPLETTFEGRLVAETRVGNFKAVIAEIRGSAYITGIHEFVLNAHDPFPEGFLI